MSYWSDAIGIAAGPQCGGRVWWTVPASSCAALQARYYYSESGGPDLL